MSHLFVPLQEWAVPPDCRTNPMLGSWILSDLFMPHFSNYSISSQFSSPRPFLPSRHLRFSMAVCHSFSSLNFFTEILKWMVRFFKNCSLFVLKLKPIKTLSSGVQFDLLMNDHCPFLKYFSFYFVQHWMFGSLHSPHLVFAAAALPCCLLIGCVASFPQSPSSFCHSCTPA